MSLTHDFFIEKELATFLFTFKSPLYWQRGNILPVRRETHAFNQFGFGEGSIVGVPVDEFL
jgi:hypothetical protein